MRFVRELVKFVGVLCWLGGFLWFPLWIVALLATIQAVKWGREARHREIVDAVREARQ